MINVGKNTSIAWTYSTLNLAYGCTRVSPGCKNCYMFRMMERWRRDGNIITIRFFGKDGIDTEAIQKEINKCGKYIFVNSMSDTFHEKLSFNLIKIWFDTFKKNPDKIFQILTKRPNRALKFFKQYGQVPENCWIGTSVEDQWHLFRIDTLRRIPAKTRFISFEPLLDDIPEVNLKDIHWVIVGGESGYKGPRPMKPEWAENIRKHCEEQRVAFFFKQNGGIGTDGAGGDLLNGVRYQQMPDSGGFQKCL